mgnify:FL=1|tara:strand:- start:321 stop:1148 length:828 start_codon:yes stop_codon:yes gene_type:complete
MESKDLTIIIVTFKSEKKIANCLKSIPPQIKVIIIENSNNIDFKKNIENQFSNSECILMGENKGYAAANNIGLKLVKTRYALVLNPDTILDKNAIENFLISAKKKDEFWLIGPANDQKKKINFDENGLAEVENLKGFAIFFNISKFKEKFFDEKYFLYFEEIDLCKSVKKENGKIFLDKSIKIIHQGASSVDDIDQEELEKNRNWHWMWSTFYYHKKHKGFILALILVFPKLLSATIKVLIFFLIFNKKKRNIYFCRLSGLFNSILGNKSWYRPS